jgi:hypothetical protein
MNKSQKITTYLQDNPNAAASDVARKFKTHVTWVYALRKRMNNIEPEVKPATARQEQYGGDHYLNMGVQPWDVVDTWPIQQRIGYYRGGALKYIMRMGSKDESPKEIAKGHHYMRKLLELLEAEQ